MKRISKKQNYIENFIGTFKWTYDLGNHIDKIDENWLKTNAECHYKITKKDITNKADALLYGIIDGKKAYEEFMEKYM